MTSTGAPLRVVIYCRLSKDREGAGVNTDEQERLCREYAAQRGYDVAEIFTDDDLTAYTKSSRYKPRPGYALMLEGLRARKYDAVIAWHTDRLHRSNTELDDYIDATGGLNGDCIPTWTVKGTPIDLSTASGRMVAHILAAVAKQEVEHAIERIRASKERNRVNGLRTSSTAPFGYRTDDRDYDGKQIPGLCRGLVIVPEEAAAVRRAYADFLAGVTLGAIAREWTEAGYATHRGGNTKWESYQIRRLLLRAANAGLIEHPVIPYGKGQIIGRAAWEPVVDEETFYAAKAILMDPSRKTNLGRGGGRTPEHLLSGTGILICGVCGGQAYSVKTVRRIAELVSEDDPKRYKYLRYQCRENWSHPGRNKRHLEAWVQAVVIERLAERDTIEAHQPQEIDVTPLRARRNGLQHRLDEIARLLESGDMDPEVAAKASRGLRGQLDQADQAVADAYAVTQRHLREFEECDGREAVARVWFGDGDGDPGLTLARKREIISMLYRFRIHPTKKGRRPANDPLDTDTIERIDVCETDAAAIGAALADDGTPLYKVAEKRRNAEAELLASTDTHKAIAARAGVHWAAATQCCARLVRTGKLPACPHEPPPPRDLAQTRAARRERAEAELLASRESHRTVGLKAGVSWTTAGRYCAVLVEKGELPACPHGQGADGKTYRTG